MNKKQQAMLTNYNNANSNSVREFYQKPSYYKQQAEKRILVEKRNINGYDYRVIGGNSSFFSCGYKYTDDNNKEHLVYHTYANRYDFIIEE